MSRPTQHSLKDRTRFVALNLIGQEVEAQRSDGVWLRGVLQATTAAEGLGVLLRWAVPLEAAQGRRPEASVEVRGGELVQVRARDATLAADMRDLGERESSGGGEGFLTDAVIGGSSQSSSRGPHSGGGGGGRQLERWVPLEGDASLSSSLLLDDDDDNDNNGSHRSRGRGGGGGGAGQWDQFEANRKLFGVEASFDEDAYTTRLDRSDPSYKRREREAARIAAEIKRQTSSNVHVAEERGHRSDLSEEQLYGAVIRDADALEAAGRYVVPSKRSPKAVNTTPAAPAAATAPPASAPPPSADVGESKEEEKPKKLSMRELLRRKKAAGTAKAFVPSAAKATAALPVKQYDASKQLSELLCAGMATVIAIASNTGASAPDPHWPGGSTAFAQVVPTSFRMMAMQQGMMAMPQPSFAYPPQMAMPFGQQPAGQPFFVTPQQAMAMQQAQAFPPMFAGPVPTGPADGMPHYVPRFPAGQGQQQQQSR